LDASVGDGRLEFDSNTHYGLGFGCCTYWWPSFERLYNFLFELDTKIRCERNATWGRGRACKWKCIPESNGKATPTFKHVEKRGGKGGGLSVYLERPEDSGRRRRTTKKKEYHAQ
jgi:hypothetical protein